MIVKRLLGAEGGEHRRARAASVSCRRVIAVRKLKCSLSINLRSGHGHRDYIDTSD
jgi:hypothetical protein